MLFTRGIDIWPFSFLKIYDGARAKTSMLATCSCTNASDIQPLVFDKSVIDSMMLVACWFLLLNQWKGGVIYKIVYLLYFFGYGKVCLVPVWLSHVKLMRSLHSPTFPIGLHSESKQITGTNSDSTRGPLGLVHQPTTANCLVPVPIQSQWSPSGVPLESK